MTIHPPATDSSTAKKSCCRPSFTAEGFLRHAGGPPGKAGVPGFGADHRGRARSGKHQATRPPARFDPHVLAALWARTGAVIDSVVDRRGADADRLAGTGPPCHCRREHRIHDARDHWLLVGAAAGLGAGLQPRHLFVSGPGRTAARRLRSLRRWPSGEPECVAGQRKSHLDNHHRAIWSGVHSDCQARHDDGRQSRDRRDHAAAFVHAAGAGPVDLGRSPTGPPHRYQRRNRAVDLCSQPPGVDPPDGRGAQRDADGGTDDRRDRADLPGPPHPGRHPGHGRGRGQSHRRVVVAVSGVGVDATSARPTGVSAGPGILRRPPRWAW